METSKEVGSLATIQRTRRDGKELREYRWPTFSICDVEAPTYGRKRVDTCLRGL
jgi:hypothetical protein